jgi:F0F1-type ATP synthase membrane subunit b/b'
LLLIGFLYKKLKSLIQHVLDHRINHIAHDLLQSKEINHQAQKLFEESRDKMEKFEQIKNTKLNQAEQNALKIRSEYVKNTERIINLKKQEFKRYLDNLQHEILHKNQLRVVDIAHDLLIEAIKSEEFRVLNKLN